NPSEIVEEAGIGDRGAVGSQDGRAAGRDEPGDREGHCQAVVVEAVDGGADQWLAALDRQVVAIDDNARPEGAETTGDPGDPVRFLVTELARSPDLRDPASMRGRA